MGSLGRVGWGRGTEVQAGHLTCAFRQAHTMDLPCGQRVREHLGQSAVGKARSPVTPWAGPRHSPEPRPGPPHPLTGGSGPRSPLSRASSPGRSCAQECHLRRSGPPPAGPPELGDHSGGNEEGNYSALPEAPACPPAPPRASPRARPTWPLERDFLRRSSANWQQDRKGPRQAGCCTRAARCSQERIMGSLVSPSWQQRLASGEAYWPTTGPGEGTHRETHGDTSHFPPGPLDTQGLTLRDQELG